MTSDDSVIVIQFLILGLEAVVYFKKLIMKVAGHSFGRVLNLSEKVQINT